MILAGPKLEVSNRDEFLGQYIFNLLRKMPMEKQFQVRGKNSAETEY